MKLLTAKDIKKVLYGVILSDGHIDLRNQRFDLYTKHEEYAVLIYEVLSQITGTYVTIKDVIDKRGYTGYRVFTRKHAYFKNIGSKCYMLGRKRLTGYNTQRLSDLSLAHIWMCDGYLEHSKNKKNGTVQNIGWFCLEAFPKEGLELFQKALLRFGISSSLVSKPWGYGYRVRIGGLNLQRFISLVYPHIISCFKYKTPLFYKRLESADMSLPNAGQYIHTYKCIEDIVRHPLKKGKT